MVIGIDCSNIKAGGGITHIKELLGNLQPSLYDIEKIIIWGPSKTLKLLPNSNWLVKITPKVLDKSFIHSYFWQNIFLSKELKKRNCHILFNLNSLFIGSFSPFVTISQNLLPFDRTEKKRFGFNLTRLRYEFLKVLQLFCFKKADGIIFLTKFAREKAINSNNKLLKKSVIIPHGFNRVFFNYNIKRIEKTKPIQILYVSTINMYKHQWNVAKAVFELKKEGYDIKLNLIGAKYEPAYKKLIEVITKETEYSNCVNYLGPIKYEKLKNHYHSSDLFVFASSCETFGIILLEAMAAGLPIACADNPSLKETLGSSAVYFNPLDHKCIQAKIKQLINDSELSYNLAKAAQKRAENFSWEKASTETFNFLNKIKL